MLGVAENIGHDAETSIAAAQKRLVGRETGNF
jgi:hypothetical protein